VYPGCTIYVSIKLHCVEQGSPVCGCAKSVANRVNKQPVAMEATVQMGFLFLETCSQF